jgi:hypothetical protein
MRAWDMPFSHHKTAGHASSIRKREDGFSSEQIRRCNERDNRKNQQSHAYTESRVNAVHLLQLFATSVLMFVFWRGNQSPSTLLCGNMYVLARRLEIIRSPWATKLSEARAASTPVFRKNGRYLRNDCASFSLGSIPTVHFEVSTGIHHSTTCSIGGGDR